MCGTYIHLGAGGIRQYRTIRSDITDLDADLVAFGGFPGYLEDLATLAITWRELRIDDVLAGRDARIGVRRNFGPVFAAISRQENVVTNLRLRRTDDKQAVLGIVRVDPQHVVRCWIDAMDFTKCPLPYYRNPVMAGSLRALGKQVSGTDTYHGEVNAALRADGRSDRCA